MDAMTPQESAEEEPEELLRLEPKMGGRYEMYVSLVNEETGRASGTTVSPREYLALLRHGKLTRPPYTRRQVLEFLCYLRSKKRELRAK